MMKALNIHWDGCIVRGVESKKGHKEALKLFLASTVHKVTVDDGQYNLGWTLHLMGMGSKKTKKLKFLLVFESGEAGNLIHNIMWVGAMRVGDG